MSTDFIINVTEVDFEDEVLTYSDHAPVIVDFWAEWCKPCKILSPMLEEAAIEQKGAIRLAKVNVDENPNLALRYNVRSIPVVKAFLHGQVVSEFSGVQPEDAIQSFISQLAPSPLDLTLEKADSHLMEHEWTEGEECYREILDDDPGHPAALLGLAKCLLGLGESQESMEILQDFPTSYEFKQAEALLPLGQALQDLSAHKLSDDTPLDAAFLNALKLVSRDNIPAALDGLLDILRQDKHYKDGRAHSIILALLELLGEYDPQTRQYRTELASVLF